MSAFDNGERKKVSKSMCDDCVQSYLLYGNSFMCM